MAKKPAKPTPPPALPASIVAFLSKSDKRTTIMRAAMIHFLANGYSETSMDAVTEAAGVSKATVYAHFASKEILFQTLMQEGGAAVFANFPALKRGANSPEDELVAFFEPVLQHILVDGGHAWDRLVIAEAVRHPEHAELFHRCALDRLQSLLDDYLSMLDLSSLTTSADRKMAAESLMALVVIAPLHTLLLLGPNATDFRPSLRWNVRLFLRGLGFEGSRFNGQQ